MLTAKEVKDVALQCGADLVGVGSMDRFEGAPIQCDPRYIMPRAKSIIGMAFRIHRGLLRGIEEGTYFAGYPAVGYSNINDVYAPIVCRELASFLEDNGYEALPYVNTSVRLGSGTGTPVEEGKPAPDVFLHFRIAGVICGLGEIGYSKLFLTKEFGPAQRLVFLLTEAELEPDPIIIGAICDRCMKCVRACPGKAISPDNEAGATVAGHNISWGELDVDKCTAVYQAGTREISPFLNEETAGFVDKVVNGEWKDDKQGLMDYTDGKGIWGYLKDNVPYIKNASESFHHPAAICGSTCMRVCIDHLEKKGALTRKFKYNFKDRAPWRIKTEADDT